MPPPPTTRPLRLPSLGIPFRRHPPPPLAEKADQKRPPPPPNPVRPVALTVVSAATLATSASLLTSSLTLAPPAAALGALVGAVYASVDAVGARSAAWLASLPPLPPPSRPLGVLITGGSRGLGRALAAEFAARGDAVVITSRSAAAARAAAAELNETLAAASGGGTSGGRVTGIRCDVSDPASVGAAVPAAVRALGGRRLDVLVNNAASRPPGGPRPLAGTPPSDLAATFATNLAGTALCCAAGIEAMTTQRPPGGGAIFNVDGAGSGGRATPGFAAYAGAKAGVASLTRSLAAELEAAGSPVGVHVISPGMVLTPLLLEGSTPAARATAFNWFAEHPAAVAAFLVPRMRAVAVAHGRPRRRPRSVAIRVLTPATAAGKLLASAVRARRRHFDADGEALYSGEGGGGGGGGGSGGGNHKLSLATAYALSMAGGLVAVAAGWWG